MAIAEAAVLRRTDIDQSNYPPMPVIVGAPRSGTTLLRFMLDAHSEMAIPPETWFLALTDGATRQSIADREKFLAAITNYPPDAPGWNDFGIAAENMADVLRQIELFDIAEGFRAFYRLYAGRMGKKRWGDKTPGYVFHMEAIGQILPEARFIHIVRDGRDSCLSWRQTWFSPGSDIRTLASSWRDWVFSARRQGMACSAYLEIHYEDLVKDPRGTLELICRFVELEFQPAMLRYYEKAAERLKEHRERRSSDGRVVVTQARRLQNQQATTKPPDATKISQWRAVLTPAEQAEFLNHARDALRAFGYER